MLTMMDLSHHRSPGRIVEAYIESFEALSSDGLLNIIVQNTGSLTATYKVYAAYCSPGVDYIPEKSVTIGPGEETNVTFIVHSFHAIGKINTCEGMFSILQLLMLNEFVSPIVEMCDQTGKRLDNLTIFFETADTCFCHGHCGCSVSIIKHAVNPSLQQFSLSVRQQCLQLPSSSRKTKTR